MISSKRINIIILLLTAAVLIFTVYAMVVPNDMFTGNKVGTFSYGGTHDVTVTENDYYTTYTKTAAAKINLNNDYAESDSRNVIIDGGDVSILGGGVYILSGTLANGSITVNSEDGAEVRLILNGVNITSSDFSAIYVEQSAKTVISLVPGTENILSDGSEYNDEKQNDGKPNAALHSKDDLVINGGGTLTVNGNCTGGIKVGDTLMITEGNITVNAVKKGIDANDYIAVFGSEITVNSGADAIKSEHESKNKGFIVADSAQITVESDGDGIYASSAIYMDNTEAKVITGGGSANAQTKNNAPRAFKNNDDDTPSTKAIKAGNNIVTNGGNFIIDSADDAFHSDGDITVEKGNFTVSSGDDAFHADLNLTVSPETMNIKKCYEGLEGAYVTVNGGEISIVSDDDGINAVGENSGGFGMMPQGHGGEEKTAEEDIWLTINGGHVLLETSGDGFDSNGSAVINGGFLEIYGPEDGGNGSIDIGDGGYVLIMNGGQLLAAGNSGMAEHPSENSPQNSMSFYLDENYSVGSSISVKSSGGTEIISGNSSKKFNWVCVSTEDIKEGETYTLEVNGSDVASVTANTGFTSYGNKNNGHFGRGKQ